MSDWYIHPIKSIRSDMYTCDRIYKVMQFTCDLFMRFVVSFDGVRAGVLSLHKSNQPYSVYTDIMGDSSSNNNNNRRRAHIWASSLVYIRT